MNIKLFSLDIHFEHNQNSINYFFDDELVIEFIEDQMDLYSVSFIESSLTNNIENYILEQIEYSTKEDNGYRGKLDFTVFFTQMHHELDFKYDIVIFDGMIEDDIIFKMLKPVKMKAFL